MSARRDARAKTLPISDTTAIPVELRAGACLEVWAPGDHWKARRRWQGARDAWLLAHGIHPNWDRAQIPASLRRCRMWSFEYVRDRYSTEMLASTLDSHDLPPTWAPVYVETYDYGPSLLPESLTWESFKQRREAPLAAEPTDRRTR